MYSCLYDSTPRTLIAIDEFGKGTADVDGLALLSASIQNFLDRGENCPHILISTHFHSLLNLIPHSPLIKLQVNLNPKFTLFGTHVQLLLISSQYNYIFQTLDFLMENEEITYLYKVKDGSVNQSFALNAAFNMGFAKDLIFRAKHVSSNFQNRKLVVFVVRHIFLKNISDFGCNAIRRKSRT